MVLKELERALSEGGIDPICKQLQSSLAPDLRHEEVPNAELYVVDAQVGDAAAIALLTNILDRCPRARLIVIGQMFTEESSYSFLRRGAKGLLTYADAYDQLPKAVPQVAAGGFWVPRSVLSGFVESILSSGSNGHWSSTSVTGLSPREQEVLDAVLQNLSNKEIANKLNISERTVKFHVSHLLEKFCVRRRADLIMLWYQRGQQLAGNGMQQRFITMQDLSRSHES
jgi:NarL family two-component system response regulator LiaR